jgi:hypothetical protein
MSEGPGRVVFVSEAFHIANELGELEELAAAAWSMPPPSSHQRNTLLRSEAAMPLDRLLTCVARREAALDVAIGEGLRTLHAGRHTMRFGYAGIGDYARERLGINASSAVKMARRADRLRDHPHLRNAVWLGELSISKADEILPRLRSEEEEALVAEARTSTVLALREAARGAGLVEPEEDEKWERVFVQIFPDARQVWNEALELAGSVMLDPAAPKWQRVEAICQEYLGAHVCPDDATEKDMALSAPVSDWLQELKADLEKATRQWEQLDRVDPVVAPVPSVPVMDDPTLLDTELRRLTRMRTERDELFGHLAMVMKLTGLWRDAGFASFGHYCAERLGMSVRAVEQRVALERRLYALPALRQALREGRISYEKARAIAWHATDQTVVEWIERARGTTCIALRREIEAREEAQISAGRDLDLRMPVRVHRLLEDAMKAARAAAGKWITPSERLKRIAQHFVDVYKDHPKPRNTVQRRVLERDEWSCRAPGCSRVEPHVHHVIFRSQGGDDDETNLVSLCAAHHLHGIHDGWIRVSGKAPDQLRWSLTSPVEADPWWRGDDPARSTDDPARRTDDPARNTGDTDALVCDHAVSTDGGVTSADVGVTSVNNSATNADTRSTCEARAQCVASELSP